MIPPPSALVQVESLSIRPERPLVVMTVTRPRRSFGLPCNFMDRDAFDWLTDDYMARVRDQGDNTHYPQGKAWPRGDEEYTVDVYSKTNTERTIQL